jgi:hypothetical protein
LIAKLWLKSKKSKITVNFENRVEKRIEMHNHKSLCLCGSVCAIANWPIAFWFLLTAVASYCDAKANQGKWLVRIEDTDIPRIYPNSENTYPILH